MTLKEMYRFVLDKLELPEGNRQYENIIKTSINIAYTDLCSKIPIIVETSFTSPFNRILFLPVDNLKSLELYHSDLGAIKDTDYNEINGKIVLSNSILANMNNYDSSKLNVLYAQKQKQLTSDTESPNVNEQYHKALCYYALYLYSNDEKFLAQYNDIVNEASYNNINESNYDEIIKDVYGTIY